MTTPRSRESDVDVSVAHDGAVSDDESPELNVYEIHSERVVLTEPDNTDGWIATDTTVIPRE
ncbi:MAG: hypothetical protein ABEH47_00705 [Haloferacaceae archaeon]